MHTKGFPSESVVSGYQYKFPVVRGNISTHVFHQSLEIDISSVAYDICGDICCADVAANASANFCICRLLIIPEK